MAEIEDIKKLLNKQDNSEQSAYVEENGIPASQTLTAQEFVNLLVQPLIDATERANQSATTIVQGGVEYKAEGGVIQLPGAETQVKIISQEEIDKPITIIDGVAKLHLRGVSVQNQADTYEQLVVEVSTAPIGSYSFTPRGSFTLRASSSSSNVFTEVDITQFLATGEQQVMLTATGQLTKVTSTLLFANIILSNLKLEFATEWHNAQTGSIKLAYKIYGSIAKTLTVKIDGITVVNGRAISGVYTEVPYSENMEFNGSSYCTHGVHRVEAYLTSGTKSTEVIENEVFFLGDMTDTRAYIVVNNLATTAQPYVDSKLFDYAVFKAGSSLAPMQIKIQNNDGSMTYLTQDLGKVTTNQMNPYVQALEIESNQDEVPLYVWFYTKNDNDEEIAMQYSSSSSRTYSLVVLDNSVSYSPTSMQSGGLIINPKIRSNSENNPLTIVNGLDGAVIPSTWRGFGLINDAWLNINNVSSLKVPAGCEVTIDYDPFSSLVAVGSTASVTMEFDIKISNLRSAEAELEPVLDINTILPLDGLPLGFQMLPLRAFLLTMNSRNLNAQDISYQEDERTHIAVNIVSNLYGSGINYVRFFINGSINREFSYVNDQFAASGGSGGIRIGSSSADVDIYGIRIYKQALSSANIMQDVKSALPTAAQKNEYQRRNDLLGDNSTIDYDKCQNNGINSLLWIPDDTSKNIIPNYTNNGKNCTTGTIVKLVYNDDGTLNYHYCEKVTHMKQKGQGTSSMTYWKWNVTYQSTKDSQRFFMDENYNWVLDETVSGEDVYMLWPNGTRNDIKGIKNVAKINWASSMQSHKMGSVNEYTDLHRLCVSNNAQFIKEKGGDPNYRPSCMQIPMLCFIQRDPTNSASIEFYCQYTIGSGKGDKPAFGNKAKSPLYKISGANQSIYTMLEGSTNGAPLPERKIPWLTDEIFYYYNPADGDDGKNETFVYGIEGDSQLDFDAGPKFTVNDDYDVPNGFTQVDSKHWQETEDNTFDPDAPDGTPDRDIMGGNTIKVFRRAYNFDFEHVYRLQPIASKEELDRRTDLNRDYQYWVTQGSGAQGTTTRVNQYDLFRWNPLTNRWVNAGTKHSTDTEDGYARMNILTQCMPWFTKYNITYVSSDPNSLNEAFRKARIQHYYEESGKYYNEVDCDFSQAFRKLRALSDNWCKNTYEYISPDGLICEASDDNDTQGPIDNVGAAKKPYYVEEHDRCTAAGDYDEEGSSTYWNSETNNRYCLREQARGSEICSMTASILNAMTNQEGSTAAWQEKYYYSTYKMFPQIVYNEVAKLLYEEAKTAMANNQYTNNTDPLTQSLGDFQQAERQYWKRRLPYMASYSNANEFANKSGTGSFSFRSVTNVNGSSPSYRFTVTAHQWIYPSASKDGTVVTSFKKRMKAGETFTFPEEITSDGNTNIMLNGADYYTSFGDLTGFAIGGDTLNISGKRLTEFKVDGTDGNFRPAAVAFAAPRLQNIEIKNVASVTGAPNLSACTILESVDFSGCGRITSLTMPQADTLTYAAYPPNITSVTLNNVPNLETLLLGGHNSITNIAISGCHQKVYNYILDLVAILIA